MSALAEVIASRKAVLRDRRRSLTLNAIYIKPTRSRKKQGWVSAPERDREAGLQREDGTLHTCEPQPAREVKAFLLGCPGCGVTQNWSL